MIDVERPLPEPLAALNRFILRWITSTRYITDAIQQVNNAAKTGSHAPDATMNVEGAV